MITRQEIMDVSRMTNLEQLNTIEKNYVLSWVLAGIFKFLGDKWLFKGGTCIKKCYFETYRFSEDLDFTLADEMYFNQDFIYFTFQKISEWVSKKTGILLIVQKEDFDSYNDSYSNYRGKIAYIGPLKRTDNPKIKIDLTVKEILCSKPIKKEIFHPYTDYQKNIFHVMCYSYEELFAEKIRAFFERENPRDLYDLVNLYRHSIKSLNIDLLKDIFYKKCRFKKLSIPKNPQENKEAINSSWEHMLKHQLSHMPSVKYYWKAFSDFLKWFDSSETIDKKPSIPLKAGHQLVKDQVYDLKGLDVKTKSLIENIRFASINHLQVRIKYKDKDKKTEELIEAYALGKKENKHFILYAWSIDENKVITYLSTRIKSVEITDEYFNPRYNIDIIPDLKRTH